MHFDDSPPRRGLPYGSRWRRPFSVLQTNLQQIDAGMDVDSALDALQDYGADTWLLNAGGISAFYPTDLPFQTRNPFLTDRPSGDLLGDAVAAAKLRGIQIIARFDMSKLPTPIAQEHPEWLYESPEGAPQIYNGLYSACPSGQYYQSRSLDIVDEVLDRYEVDAFFFNWFTFNEHGYDGVNYGPCHCANCRAGFAEYSDGAEHPQGMGSKTFGAWRKYTGLVLAKLTAKIVDHVSARERDIGVILRSGAPIAYLEGNNAFRGTPGKDFWPFAIAQAVSAHTASRTDSAVMVNSVAFIDLAYRMGGEQPEHFAQYLIQTIARGGNPSAYYLGAPDRLPMQASIQLGRDVMRFRHKHADLYGELRPAADIAIVQPSFTSVNAGTYGEIIDEFRGIYEALVERHLPFDVVPVDALSELAEKRALDGYALVIVPDVGVLSTGASAIDAFVDRGGRLLLTGSAGVDREGGVELASSPALREVRTASSGKELWSTYVTDVEQPGIANFSYRSPIIPVIGRYHRFAWKPEATTIGFALPAAPFAPPELAYGHVESDDPDYVRSRFGRGEVVAIPWTIGRTYREYGKTEVRDHLVSVVESLVERRISTNLHERVELVVAQSGASMVIHLINHSGAGRRSYRAHVPMPGGTLRLIGRGDEDLRATALVAGVDVPSNVDGADRTFELPALDLFEVLRIAPGSDASDEAARG